MAGLQARDSGAPLGEPSQGLVRSRVDHLMAEAQRSGVDAGDGGQMRKPAPARSSRSKVACADAKPSRGRLAAKECMAIAACIFRDFSQGHCQPRVERH
jgi:hypothetical protein